MNIKNILILSTALSVLSSTGAFALQSEHGQTAHRIVHKHHLATYRNPNTASDVNRDAGMYVVKPEAQPEYFGHATGSDGSMPQN